MIFVQNCAKICFGIHGKSYFCILPTQLFMLMIVFSASLPLIAQQNAPNAEVEDEAAMLAEFEANFS